ncbi:hypothetical protein CEXT_207161 [Caerostris extrusa]|uniref:Uncharacterized protein n=1 Tax=Caerostris extrusa TaxID=172846 RepID=A0AAV4VKU1_CAEEX|nr:hypothetical protein CEXT_207161 [Caerostris extrusa]
MSLFTLLYAVRVRNVPIPIMSLVDFRSCRAKDDYCTFWADYAQRNVINFAYHFINNAESIPQWKGNTIDSLKIGSIWTAWGVSQFKNLCF